LQPKNAPRPEREAGALLDRAERAGGLGHWVWRGAGCAMEWSPGMRRILGITDLTTEATHTHFLAAVHPEDRDLIARALESALKNARGWQLAHRIQKVDGEERSVRTEVEFCADPGRLEGVVLDVTDRLEAQRRVRELAHHDPFTCLLGRQRLIEHLAQVMSAAEPQGDGVGLVFLGLDHFDRIAETVGRERSEGLLIAVAERLASGLRRTRGRVAQGRVIPTVSRLGFDEFVVVIPDLEHSGHAARIAERLRELLAKPFSNGDYEMVIAASIGVAIFPEAGRDPERLIEQASIAMREYRGSGRIGFFSQEMSARADRARRVESALLGVVDRGELSIALQSQVSAATGELVGAEALVRWNSPQLGVVTPDEFIPMAERVGRIHEIGRFVLDVACREAARWKSRSRRTLSLGVNVSARQLERPAFIEEVHVALSRHGVPPSSLHVEITETALIEKQAAASETVRLLKQLGAKISLDDFGTGYSTLRHLAHFEMDIVKIDKSFVSKLADDPHQRAVVGAMIGLAHRLGAEVIAEGVETEEQEHVLREEGCDLLQGYRYARPAPPEQFLEHLETFQPVSSLADRNVPGAPRC
jgi:diguanylate cyclase (GGDEF)-like protein